MRFHSFALLALIRTNFVEARGKLGSKSKAIIKTDKEFVHRLRACNAYASGTSIEIIHHRKNKDKATDENLTKAGKLSYKACRDFAIHLLRGDSVEFIQNSSHLGSFAVASLPQRDALLLLVLHHRSPESAKPAFSSHIFSSTHKSAQLAVLDVYNGPEIHTVQIRDSSRSKDHRAEDLHYDTVVSITPGDYECGLKDKSTETARLAAMTGESYIAMRVGMKSKDASKDIFPEEIVVFPSPSGAAQMWQGSMVLLVVLLCSLH